MDNLSKNHRGMKQHMLLVCAAVCVFVLCGILAGAKVLQNDRLTTEQNDQSQTVSLVFANETRAMSVPTEQATQSPADTGTKINLNTAGVKDLLALKGIGQVKAEAIMEYRRENGRFLSVYELMQVSGIGEKIFAEIKDKITI
ncbi:MAG: helix-hairpin-helix domain-containing protein [Oscillospiraceae bacterium]|nr:helix-hairpin-helix domain-containing protein [Oscillospiraceae bacterium]